MPGARSGPCTCIASVIGTFACACIADWVGGGGGSFVFSLDSYLFDLYSFIQFFFVLFSSSFLLHVLLSSP